MAHVAVALATISASCSRANGQVDVRRGGDAEWRPLALGGVLRAGDVVRTGPASFARLSFLAGGRLDLDENATVEVGVTPPAPESGGAAPKESTVSVESGVVRGVLPPKGEAGLVIRGADGSKARVVASDREPTAFRVTRGAKRTELAITKGDVEVRGTRGKKKIHKGHAIDVAERLGEPERLLSFPASIEPGVDARFKWAGDLSIRLAWKPVPKATGYRVQIASDLSFATVNRTADVEGIHAAFSPPSVGTYAWRVASRDRAGRYGEYGFARRIFCERELPRDLLVGPPDRAVLKLSDEQAALAFTWQSAASAQGYRLVVATDPALLEHKVVSRATSGQRIEVKGLAAGEYYWGVFVDGARPEPIFLRPRSLVVRQMPKPTTNGSKTMREQRTDR